MPRQENVFDKLVWRNGRMRLGDLVFEVEDRKESRKRDTDEAAFSFLKTKRMIDQYATFWRLRSDFAPRHILEIGIHKGGSLVSAGRACGA